MHSLVLIKFWFYTFISQKLRYNNKSMRNESNKIISTQKIQHETFTVELHGFTRLAVGERFGGSYTHFLFLRGKSNMARFMIKSKNVEKTRLRRGSSDTGFQSQSKSQSKNLHCGRSCSYWSGLPRGSSALSTKEGFESHSRHHEEDVPRIIANCDHDRRSTKKHKSNKSWSPINTACDDSAAVTKWLSSTFGGTEAISEEDTLPIGGVEGREIFNNVIGVEDDDDTYSIHSFSSLPTEETVASTPISSNVK